MSFPEEETVKKVLDSSLGFGLLFRSTCWSIPLSDDFMFPTCISQTSNVWKRRAPKMVDDVEYWLEVSLDNLVSVTEKSDNLRKGLKDLILKSNLCRKNKKEQNALHAKVKETAKQLQKERNLRLRSRQVAPSLCSTQTHITTGSESQRSARDAATSSARHMLPSRGGNWSGGTSVETSAAGSRRVLPSADLLYSEAVKGTVEKRYKLAVKSKTDNTTEAIKHILRININPTEIKIGINTFKSLKDGRVLIEDPTKEEINVLSEKINAKCGNELDVHVPTLFKPSGEGIKMDMTYTEIINILKITVEIIKKPISQEQIRTIRIEYIRRENLVSEETIFWRKGTIGDSLLAVEEVFNSQDITKIFLILFNDIDQNKPGISDREGQLSQHRTCHLQIIEIKQE
ncbi:hypothetical protein C0J52_26327 [Blattella germanica]|nr:hypothetical protein C0J52_26327 [Blattella germanica]